MHRAERIGDIKLSHACEFFCKFGVVFLLAGIETQVLQQQKLTRLQRGRLGLGILADDIPGEEHVHAQQLRQALGHRCKREALLPRALRLAEVRAGDHGSAVVEQVADRRQRGHDALVARDLAGCLVLRNIEVTAQQHFFAGKRDVPDGHFVVVHLASSWFVISHRRVIWCSKIQIDLSKQVLLAQCLIAQDRRGIGQIQAARLRTHGDTQAVVGIALAQPLGQPLRLLAEHERHPWGGEIGVGVAHLRLCREQPEILIPVSGEVLVDVLIHREIDQMPVVKSGALDGAASSSPTLRKGKV